MVFIAYYRGWRAHSLTDTHTHSREPRESNKILTRITGAVIILCYIYICRTWLNVERQNTQNEKKKKNSLKCERDRCEIIA